MDNGLESFGDRLNHIKDYFGYTNGEIGEICGVSHTAIQKLINGETSNPKLDLVSRLERNLSLRFDWLFYGEGEMFKKGSEIVSKNNIISNSKTRNKGDIIQSQGGYHSKEKDNSTSEFSKDIIIESLKNEKSSLEKENEFLKKQLEFVNSLLDKAMSK